MYLAKYSPSVQGQIKACSKLQKIPLNPYPLYATTKHVLQCYIVSEYAITQSS